MSKNIDILFVYPPTGWEPEAMYIAENDAPPMGILYIAAMLRDAGIEVQILDLNHTVMNDCSLLEFISRAKPRIIGISVLTTSSKLAKHLTVMIKGRFQETLVVAGGIHATVLPMDLLAAGADYVVRGEGEGTMLELVLALFNNESTGDIPGISYIDGHSAKSYMQNDVDCNHDDLPHAQSLVNTDKRNILGDLDSLPFPARDLVPIRKYGQAGAICSSRGCPHSCTFCSSVLSTSHSYRLRSVTKTIEEMDYTNDRFSISRFQFLDDNFTAKPDRTADLARLLLEREYIWSCQTTIMELANRLDVLNLMFQAGCREIYFGIETGSKQMMHDTKGIDLDTALAVLNHAASLNSGAGDRLQTVVGFIIGHPDDTEESVEETIKLALQLRQLHIDTMLSIMQPYPGSLLYRTPERYGIKIENADYSEYLYPKANMSTQYLSRERIRALYASGLLRIMETYKRDE